MKELQQILARLDPHIDVLESEALNELHGMDDNLRRHLESIREDGRNLRIAVIGQMKSGKSSFLNAALFSQTVLPKAETPMTAALTCIVYGEHPRAEVVFYSQDDWAYIEQRAAEYDEWYVREEARLLAESDVGPFAVQAAPTAAEITQNIPESLRACAELVDKVREHGLHLPDYLGRSKVIEDVEHSGALAAQLQDFVGSGGRFTAITKMTRLHLNDERLKGLEVIDTPGFNDPVVSRGVATRSHLANCDVIFFLSRTSEFLGAPDMAVLREQLPEAGLGDKAVFVVGTQRDLALRQDASMPAAAARMAERYPAEQRTSATLAAMLQLLDRKMAALAEETFGAQSNRENTDQRSRDLLLELQKNRPRFISAWAWLIADNLDALSNDDRIQLERLCRHTRLPLDQASLRVLSNIPALLETVLAQGSRKRELLAAKEGALTEGVRSAVRKRLEEMKASLDVRQSQIQQVTLAGLDKLEQDTVARLEKGRERLEDVFGEQVDKASTQFIFLKTSMRSLSKKYLRIDSIKEKTSESYTEDVSIFKGLFGHTWETRYRNVDTVYANVQDAIEKIERFAHESIERLQREIAGCVDLDALRKNLAAAALALFDTGSADFDGDLLLTGINKSLRRISIPNVDLDEANFTEQIVSQFGTGRVSESHIDDLKQAHRKAIQGVLGTIESLVDAKIDDIEKSLTRSGKTFVDKMSRDITDNLRKLREQRADQERSLARIAVASKAVEACLGTI